MLSNGVVEITNKLIIDYRAREWCKLPYPDHPKGCPNYSHKATCPPQVCLVEDWCDLQKPMWFIIVPFNLKTHIEKMLSLHPNWTDRQARCVLYWQSRVNRQLEDKSKLFTFGKNLIFTICPEAMGVNVIKTLRNMNFTIVPRP